MLELIRARVAARQGPDAFVLDLVRDEAYRRDISDRISGDAVPFDYPVTVISR